MMRLDFADHIAPVPSKYSNVKSICNILTLNVVKLWKLVTFCRMFIKTATEETSVSYIKTMFIKVNQGFNHPEAGLMYTVLIGNPKIYKKKELSHIKRVEVHSDSVFLT